MNTLQSVFESTCLGSPTSFRNMTVFPILVDAPEPARYVTLDDAIAAGGLRITEVSDGGEVANLKATNTLDLPVLLLDGEEVVGAKQNRIFNLSILIPAKTDLVVPVSCVEAGRWRHDSAEFTAAPRAQYAAGRGERMQQVSASMQRAQGARSDQHEVWSNIAEKQRRLGVQSATGAMADIYGRLATSVDEYVSAFTAVDGQSGAAFALNGKMVGLDLFDCPATFGKLLPKLLRSYALDAIEAAAPQQAETPDAAALIDSVANCEVRAFDAVGLGTDLRLTGEGVRGAALYWDGRVVHLCAFRAQAPATQRTAGMARASRRGRFTSSG